MGNDADRYRRFLDGDDDGLREIIDIHYNGLMFYINGIVHDISETENIVQETFFKIAVKKLKFNEKSEFKTWLYAIARNYAYNYLKRHKARFSDCPIDSYEHLADVSSLERQFLQSEQYLLLHQVMRELSDDYFQVLYLMYFESLKTEDIAIIMHKSKRQVGDLLYRAKKSLKTKLEKAGFQYEEF